MNMQNSNQSDIRFDESPELNIKTQKSEEVQQNDQVDQQSDQQQAYPLFTKTIITKDQQQKRESKHINIVKKKYDSMKNLNSISDIHFEDLEEENEIDKKIKLIEEEVNQQQDKQQIPLIQKEDNYYSEELKLKKMIYNRIIDVFNEQIEEDKRQIEVETHNQRVLFARQSDYQLTQQQLNNQENKINWVFDNMEELKLNFNNLGSIIHDSQQKDINQYNDYFNDDIQQNEQMQQEKEIKEQEIQQIQKLKKIFDFNKKQSFVINGKQNYLQYQNLLLGEHYIEEYMQQFFNTQQELEEEFEDEYELERAIMQPNCYLDVVEMNIFERINAYHDLLPLLMFRKKVWYLQQTISNFAYKIIKHSYFEFITLLVIIFNSVTLALDDPKETEKSQATENFELGFLIFYTFEMLIKIIGMGFIFNKGAYLRDQWNILDFVIVTTAYIPIILQSEGNVNLQSLRSLRVLRPLRTISTIKELRNILGALFASFGLLKNAVFILIFCLMVFAIAGLQLFSGVLKKRCFQQDTGVTLVLGEDETYCSVNNDCSDYNTSNIVYICGKQIQNPNYGVTNFDTIGWAFLQVFQITTLEGWSEIMISIQKTFNPWTVFYFILVVFIGAFFLINLTLAIIKFYFSMVQGQEEKKDEEEEKEIQEMQQNGMSEEEIEQALIRKKIEANDQEIGYNMNSFKDWGIYISNKDKYEQSFNIENYYYINNIPTHEDYFQDPMKIIQNKSKKSFAKKSNFKKQFSNIINQEVQFKKVDINTPSNKNKNNLQFDQNQVNKIYPTEVQQKPIKVTYMQANQDNDKKTIEFAGIMAPIKQKNIGRQIEEQTEKAEQNLIRNKRRSSKINNNLELLGQKFMATGIEQIKKENQSNSDFDVLQNQSSKKNSQNLTHQRQKVHRNSVMLRNTLNKEQEDDLFQQLEQNGKVNLVFNNNNNNKLNSNENLDQPLNPQIDQISKES